MRPKTKKELTLARQGASSKAFWSLPHLYIEIRGGNQKCRMHIQTTNMYERNSHADSLLRQYIEWIKQRMDFACYCRQKAEVCLSTQQHRAPDQNSRSDHAQRWKSWEWLAQSTDRQEGGDFDVTQHKPWIALLSHEQVAIIISIYNTSLFFFSNIKNLYPFLQAANPFHFCHSALLLSTVRFLSIWHTKLLLYI